MGQERVFNSGAAFRQPRSLGLSSRDVAETLPRVIDPGDVGTHLRATAVSWGVPAKIASELIKEHATVFYKKGSIIFMQDSPGDVLFWVLSGLVKVCCTIKSRERLTVGLAGPGELVGFANWFDTAGRTIQAFEARAITDCTLAVLTRERIEQAFESLEPASLIRFIMRLNATWSKTLQTRVRFLGLDFQTRLSEVLVDLSARFGVKGANGVMLVVELCHGDLAEMVGCSRPLVTKLVRKMMFDGSLGRNGRRYVVLNEHKFNRASA